MEGFYYFYPKIASMSIRQHIPNSITVLNLSSGMLSLIYTLEGNLVVAASLIFLAAVFDFLDGTAARLLKAYSVMGKELDSLADVVSFGVAPGLIIYQMLSVHCAGSCNLLERYHITPYFALLIPVMSALRLAKFNTDPRQEVNFVGLPTPANAIFFASVPLVLFLQPRLFALIHFDILVNFLSNTRVLAILVVFFSYLLVSDVKLFSLKFKTLDWKGNSVRYIFLSAALLMLLLFTLQAIPLIVLAYLGISLFIQGKL
jgi:CDP-diacylglycerol---serine O-phosphatidyltransferase